MNYDRFLTRVWDKQEKKMLYRGDEFHHGIIPCTFVSVTGDSLYYYVSHRSGTSLWNELYTLELDEFHEHKDRFIPMQCTGLRISGKLLYESDIIEAFIYSFNTDNPQLMNGQITSGGKESLWFRTKYSYCTRLSDIDLPDCKILGNIHENQELLEVKE